MVIPAQASTALSNGDTDRRSAASPHEPSAPNARRFITPVLYLVFFASGASALICQAVWQRVLSLHAGMDLVSTTTVVAAFMAGLGLGSLLGGRLADRVPPVRALFAYAQCEVGIGAFALISIWLLYRNYPQVSGRLATFGVNFLLLSVPTTLMGMTLPILSRGLVARASDIAPQVGRLFAVNTVGAAAGAAATAGWWLLGSIGLEGTVRVAATLNLVSGALALALFPVASRLKALAPAPDEPGERATPWLGRPWHWVVLYGVTGFLALGLEMAWFRLLNVLLFSNTYTFSRLLTVYLVFLGLGAAVGAPLFKSARRPDLLFLWLQLGVGLAAAAGPVMAIVVARRFGPNELLFIAPLLVLPVPTFLMGLCFPLVQRMVAETFSALGKRVGLALFANTVGCVLGTVVTGLVLLDRFGTPFTLHLLVGLLALFGLAAAALSFRAAGRWMGVGAVVVVSAAALITLPWSNAFWARLHPVVRDLAVAEDGSCVIATGEPLGVSQYVVFINGEWQAGVPFDDFHIRLGAIPALMHPSPREVLVIGLGAGSTPFGVGLDPRVQKIDLVEICGTEIPLLKALRDKGLTELKTLFADQRLNMTVQDGRKFLLDTSRQFDLIVTDTLLTHSAYSGSLYSREFFRLAKERLRPDGLFAQWIASERTHQTLAEVFPYVARVYSPTLSPGPSFMVASKSPLPDDTAGIKKAYANLYRDRMRTESLPQLDSFMDTAVIEPIFRDRDRFPTVNRDLFARDEYGRW